VGAKRAFDVAVTALGLVVAAPLGLAAAAAARVSLGKGVLFRQARAGLNGQEIMVLKLRTMTDERDADGALLPDEQRLTRVGRVLRSTSLDELPQLWNVLRGDMSLVGPRPLPMRYVPRYSEEQLRRLEALPGITGWSQVTTRNAGSWADKLELDVWYVDHQSLWLDIKILAMTVRAVLKRDGVSADGHATMPEFMGEPSA
jgi:sugar transferase EpsL